MTKLPPPMHSRTIDIVSYVLVAAMIAAVLWLHLLPAAIAGFLVYALARKLEVRLRERRTLSKSAKAIAVGGVFLIAALILAGLGIGIGRLVEHGHGLEGMLTRIADVLDNLRESLPAAVVDYVPQSVSELRVQLVQMLKEHGHQVSTIGIDGLRASALMILLAHGCSSAAFIGRQMKTRCRTGVSETPETVYGPVISNSRRCG